MALDEQYFKELAEQLGPEWERLATQLDISKAEIDHIKVDTASMADQIVDMLVTWSQRQDTIEAAANTLIDCLKRVKRADLAGKLEGPSGRGEGKQPEEAAKMTLNEKYFRELATKLGSEWERLATQLDISKAEIDHIKDANASMPDQIFKMLVTWSQRQDSLGAAAVNTLIDCLKREKRADLAGKLEGPSPNDGATVEECATALKKLYKETSSYVKMSPFIPDDVKHITDIYTTLELKDNSDHDGKVKSYEDMFRIKTKRDRLPIKRVIAQGDPGLGKSTLIDKIAYDWAVDAIEILKQFKLVVVLEMHQLTQESDLIDAIFDLLDDDFRGRVDRSVLETFITNNPDKVLILLDGFDEFMTTNLLEKSFGSILKILNRKKGRECFVLVTTRPSHFEYLVNKTLIGLEQPFVNVKVRGFDEKQTREYIGNFFSGNQTNEAQGLVQKITSSGVLSNLAKSPMLLLLMCLLWRECRNLPETMSRLYDNAIEYMLERKKMSKEEFSKVMIAIGKIALEGLISPKQKLSFKEEDFDKSVLDEAMKVGILTKDRAVRGMYAQTSIQFIHKTFQEFCAAAYCQNLVNQDPDKLNDILGRLEHHTDFEYFLRFCCGDNEACTRIIMARLLRYWTPMVWKLAMDCYFESQLIKKFPSDDFIDYMLHDSIYLDRDNLTSFMYFLKQVTVQTEGKWMAYLGKVRVMELRDCDLRLRGADLFQYIQSMKNMTSLSMFESLIYSLKEITDVLSRLPNLVELDLFDSTVDCAASWSGLGEIKQLQKLILVRCIKRVDDLKHITDALSILPNLVELHLFHIDCAAPWTCLGEIKQLQKLELSYCIKRDDDLKQTTDALSRLPNLVELDLSYSEVDRADSWSGLGEIKHLKKLKLWYCIKTDDDLKHIINALSSLPNLVELDLSGSKGVRAASWSGLGKIQKLRMLHLIDCNLTDLEKERLVDAMGSNCEVVFAFPF